ncbi:MAG: hypothetical protein ACO1NM_08235 [Sphingobium phenoxybenzoativorans]|uniref:Uncharacterized protein n=1 Tax=Sphingobium phenoxybenzoativorans TaxID=1592790 RepID=A0A975K9T6_9SPHN|nr:hypothetical protein [Sphingobium phenoxybenzoativorans]QUT07440.1 hypothetical protein KFK14_08615 [Sphingobium phenoxybenzoativorans]
MGMFDGILGNLDELAAKVGLPAEQVQSLTDSLGSKLGAGGDQVTALTELAQEHGLPVEKLQEMLAGIGGPDAIMAKVSGLLDRDGDGNPLNELGAMAKGLFG